MKNNKFLAFLTQAVMLTGVAAAQNSDRPAVVNGATRPLAKFAENVIPISANGSRANGILTDCAPVNGLTAVCNLLTDAKALGATQGQFATLELPQKQFAALWIRDFTMDGVFESLETPVGGHFEIVVGDRIFHIDLNPENDNLIGLRDAINAVAPESRLGAGIKVLGEPPQYALTLQPSITKETAIRKTILRRRDTSENLIVEHQRWTTYPTGRIELGVIGVEVPMRYADYGLTAGDFASHDELSRFDAGDPVSCIGHTPSALDEYATVRGAVIASYPFPPVPNAATFQVDASISPAQAGGLCVGVHKGGTRQLIVGMIGGAGVHAEGADGNEVAGGDLHEILKAPVILDALRSVSRGGVSNTQ